MKRGLASAADHIASYGRGPDTMLAHISPSEARFIDTLQGGRRTNPMTGLPEYGLFGKLLKAVARVGATVGAFVASGGNPLVAAGANAAVTKATGGTWKQALKSGAITGLTAGIGNAATGPSFMSNSGLSAAGGAGSAAGIEGLKQAGIEGAVNLAGTAAPAAISSAAAPTALGALYSGIGGMTGVGVGLSALAGAPLDKSAPPDSNAGQLPPGFTTGSGINLNVAPMNRVSTPYTGDPLKYGQPGQGGEHKFFSVVNPKPVYLPPTGTSSVVANPIRSEEELQGSFMARGGKARRISRAAARGRILGPGTGTSDSIPTMLSDGEHVIDEATVRLAGGGSNERGQREIERIKQAIRAKAGMKNPRKPPAFGGA